MPKKPARVVASLMGVSAGLSAYLPAFVCAGRPCSSCLACVGAGGALASALVVGLISRRMAASSPPGTTRSERTLPPAPGCAPPTLS